MSNKIKKSVEANGSSIAMLKVARENGNIVLRIKVDESIENVFKTNSISESNVYRSNGEHLSYYKLSREEMADMQMMEQEFGMQMANYGGSLFNNGRPNYSLLRTVGISKGHGVKVVVDGLISNTGIKNYVKLFKNFLSDFYRQYVSKIVIETELRIVEL